MSVTPSSRHRFLALMRTCFTLLSWYCISSAIILTTKWLFSNHFSFPLTVTTFSNTLTTLWALLLSRTPRFRAQPLTRRQFREYVLPIGIATALEIGCSNVALKILTVSFGTILKGGAPVFTMIWGLLLGIETFSVNLCMALFVIASGIALASLGEGHTLVLTGFILQIMAIALGGLRWAMTQVLLNGSPDHRMSPITATLYTSPTTAACVLPVALLLEGTSVAAKLPQLKPPEIWTIFGTMMTVGSLVFILLVSEYWLVNVTSSLAVSVAGVFKELLTIGGGILLFSEHVTLLNIIGFVICQIGIGSYAWIRYDHSAPVATEANQPEASLPLTHTEAAADGGIDSHMDRAFQATERRLELELVQTGR